MITILANILLRMAAPLTATIISKKKQKELEQLLEDRGYTFSYCKGGKFATPKKANLWVAFDKDAKILRWAPKGTYVLAIETLKGEVPPGEHPIAYGLDGAERELSKLTTFARLEQVKEKNKHDQLMEEMAREQEATEKRSPISTPDPKPEPEKERSEPPTKEKDNDQKPDSPRS